MLIPLRVPPGLYANGTPSQAAGRWRACNLVRWPDGPNLQPVGGWQVKSTSAVSGKARAILTWRDNSNTRWAGVGTHTGLYVMTASGVVHDITPASFTSGRADAVAAGGYGSSDYGTGTYGTPRLDSGVVQEATVWTLDTWDEDLVGCSPDDGKLYQWELNTAVDAAAISGAPTGCNGLVVTPEKFVLAIKDRRVEWCEQGDNTVWTPSATNQAGDLDLDTEGTLRCGRRVRGGTLIFSDVDVWVAQYQGLPAVYGFEKVGDDCGLVSNGAAVSLDTRCVWMGRNSFWAFNGYVSPLLNGQGVCEVGDYVFSDFNREQGSKVTAWHNSDFGEVWWHYPSASSVECDRYVYWSYRLNVWGAGELSRLCGAGRGVFSSPLLVDADGWIYEHESGFDYDGAQPYARSGPIMLGDGERMMLVREFRPDFSSQGDVTLTLYAKHYPNGPESTVGPVSLANPTDVPLFQARQVEVEIRGASLTSWRAGFPQLEVTPTSRR